MPYADPAKQKACHAAYRKRNPKLRSELCRRHRKKNLAKYAAKQKEYYDKHPEKYLYIVAKTRAKKKGIVFTITEAEIVIPKVCPALGIRLKRGNKQNWSSAPSLDKYYPELGYIPGNVVVMSFRANCIKHNSTLAEMEAVLQYMEESDGKADKSRPKEDSRRESRARDLAVCA